MILLNYILCIKLILDFVLMLPAPAAGDGGPPPPPPAAVFHEAFIGTVPLVTDDPEDSETMEILLWMVEPSPGFMISKTSLARLALSILHVTEFIRMILSLRRFRLS